MVDVSLAEYFLFRVPESVHLLVSSVLLLLTGLAIAIISKSHNNFWHPIVFSLLLWAASTAIAPLAVGFGPTELIAQIFGAAGVALGFDHIAAINHCGPMRVSLREHAHHGVRAGFIFAITALCIVDYKLSAAVLMTSIGFYPVCLGYVCIKKFTSVRASQTFLLQSLMAMASITQLGSILFWIYPDLSFLWPLPFGSQYGLTISTTFTATGLLVLANLFFTFNYQGYLKTEARLEELRFALKDDLMNVNVRDNSPKIMAATLIHEINQPIAAMTTSAQILERYSKTVAPRSQSDNMDLLEIITASAHRIGDILDRAHLHHSPNNASTFDVKLLITNVVETLVISGAAKREWFYISISPKQLQWKSDVVALFQILLNVFKNAAEATRHRRRPAIEIWVEQQKNELVIKIKDNGTGLVAPRVNTSSLIVADHRAGETKGLGLGLLLTKRLIAQLGGAFDIRSLEDEGAIATIHLPSSNKE